MDGRIGDRKSRFLQRIHSRWQDAFGRERVRCSRSLVCADGFAGTAVGNAPALFRETALSENLTERPLLRNFLHPLNREEPTLVTAIRLAGDTEEGTGLGEMRREQGYD